MQLKQLGYTLAALVVHSRAAPGDAAGVLRCAVFHALAPRPTQRQFAQQGIERAAPLTVTGTRRADRPCDNAALGGSPFCPCPLFSVPCPLPRNHIPHFKDPL